MTNFNFLLNNLSYLSSEDLVGRPMDSTCFRSAPVPPSFRLRLHPLRMVATLLLLLCLSVGNVWALTKTEGFETKTAEATYNSTKYITTSESDCDISWTIFYGCVSTTSKISGSNSAAMRLYSHSSLGYGYLQSTTAISNLSQVSFKAKAGTNNSGLIKMDVEYSIDNGANWAYMRMTSSSGSNYASQTPSSSGSTYNAYVPSGVTGDFLIRFSINTSSTRPSKPSKGTNNVQLTIDDVVFTYTSACSHNVTLNYDGDASGLHGSFVLKAGSASGSTIAEGGTTANCGSGTTSVVVVPTPDTHYHVSSVSATNKTGDISGPDGDGNYTITYTQGSNITSSITVTFEEDTKHTLTFNNNGTQVEQIQVYDGEKIGDDLPTLTSGDACDATSNVFAGWTTENVGSTPVHSIDGDQIVDYWTEPTTDMTINALWATTSGSPKAQFIAADETAKTASALDPISLTKNGINLYYESGNIYHSGSAHNFGINADNYCIISADGLVIEKAVTTCSGSSYKIAGVSDGTLSGDKLSVTDVRTGSLYLFANTNNPLRIVTLNVYTYDNYITSCCTSLASINGSVKVISGTSATLKWDVLSNVDGTTPYTVTVSPSAGTTVGGISTVDGYKNCTITGLTAGTEYTFTINAFGDASHCNSSQEVVATTPKITLGSASGTSTYIEGYGPGSKQTFTVTAVGLTDNLTVTAPTNFAVCATENGTYQSNITLTPTSGAVSTTVYFRLVADKTAASSPYAGSVTVSGGSATEQTVAVNGTVSPACENPTINTQPAASATYNLNVTATALSVVATKNGTGPALTYQWYSNTANSKTTPTPSPIDGATSSSYTPPTTASGTKYYFCEVSSGACAVTSNISAITVNTPTITVSETARAFGDRKKDGSYTMTFTVIGNNLAKDAGISLAISGTNANLFSIDKTSLSPTSNAVGTTTITVTYSPNVTGSHSAQIDITSTGATTKTVTLSGTSKNQFTITLNPGNGSLSATGSWTKNGDNLEQTILDGTNVTLVAPTPGCASWEFVGWKSGSAANNDASFSTSSPNRDKTATFAPEATTTYYAVYQLRASGGTTYNKITSTDDLTTGNYVIKTSSYAMKNDIEYGTYWHMKETYNTESGSSLSSPAAENIWEIIKFGSYYIIKNGTKYVGLTSDGDITFDTNSHLFSASYSSSQWTFTSATYATKQIIYNYYFRGGTAQSTSIMLYKQGSGLSGNFFSNPSCSSYTLTGVASPSDSYGTVALSATSVSTGSTAYALATPKSGYVFSHWTISGAESTMSNTVSSKSYDNPVTITMGTANTTITAHFEARVPVTFNTPAGVDAPSSSYKDVVLPSAGLPAAVDDDCWEFAGWTEEASWNDEDAPTLYAAGTRYSGDATSAFNLYAVYKRVVFEQVYDADDLEADADYVISKYSNPNEYAIKAEVSNTTKAASTNIIGKSQEISTKEYYYYFIHNPASYNIWHLTGSTDAWQLTNGDLNVNLSDAEGAILQGTAANMKITEGTGNNAALFSFQDATTATNYLGHSSTEFLIDDEATYFYVYKTYSSLYMTSPSEPTYTITWKVSGQDDDVQTITQCAGLTDSDIPSAPADNTLSSCVTSCKFVGWTETALPNATDEEPDDLFLSAEDAPMIRGDKTFYAVFANGSNVESDVINNSATSSQLGNTTTSTWVSAFDLTGSSSGAVYRIYSMGTKNGTHALQWNSSGYLYCKTAPSSGNKLTSISVTGTSGKQIKIYGANSAYSAAATATELKTITMGGTYVFSDEYQYVGINGKDGSTQINTLTITYGTYTDYRTTCCETPTFTISGTGKTVTDGKISFPVLREDLGGASTSTWAELPITISSNSSGTITIIEGTGGDAGKTAWKLSSWESRAETGGTIAATGHATFTSPSAGNYLFKVKTTTGQTGQGTYRIGIHQAADATYCEATYYLWVDVTMRDKFVDNVNGNATINVDTHGATTTTPTEASLDADKNDDCHETTRRLVGWVKETDMDTWYVTGNSTRVSNLDDKKEDAKLVAPGATITTSGATWYAVWGEEVTE